MVARVFSLRGLLLVEEPERTRMYVLGLITVEIELINK